MALIIGGIIFILTISIAFAVLMDGSNWETVQGGSPTAGVVTLVIGWSLAGAIVFSHFHPIHIGW